MVALVIPERSCPTSRRKAGACGLQIMSSPSQPPTIHLAPFRYLGVGACNTLFGTALFTMLLNPLLPYGHVVASLLANVLAITFAYFGYKWFVFRTHGHYFKEWDSLRGVYTGSMLLSAAALPFVVALVRPRNRGSE
jgi:putative flippase GtrA